MALKLLRSNTLVSPGWLHRFLGCGDRITILDCSWHLPNTGRDAKAEYAEKHIPGALFFDIEECSDKSSVMPHMLPSARTFENYVGRLGISNSSPLLVYDNNPVWGVFSSPRVWWMFRYFGHDNVAILEGGLPTWIAEGHDVTSEASKVPEEEFFAAKAKPHFKKDFEEIRANISSQEFQLVAAVGQVCPPLSCL